VALEVEPDPSLREHDLLATTADGVVVGVRGIEHRVHGTQAFWSEAISRTLREDRGYALLSSERISAGSGQRGRILRFGRDLGGHTYRYTVAVFVTDARIVVVEATGREAQYTRLEPAIEHSIQTMRF
jgi:hypothetical protein